MLVLLWRFMHLHIWWPYKKTDLGEQKTAHPYMVYLTHTTHIKQDIFLKGKHYIFSHYFFFYMSLFLYFSFPGLAFMAGSGGTAPIKNGPKHEKTPQLPPLQTKIFWAPPFGTFFCIFPGFSRGACHGFPPPSILHSHRLHRLN